jgi:hypothetical protein
MSKRSLTIVNAEGITQSATMNHGEWIKTTKRTKGNDGNVVFFALDVVPKDILKIIVKLYATLKWREYMFSARRTRNCMMGCNSFSGVVASALVPDEILCRGEVVKIDKETCQEIPYGWFPFQKFYWGPTSEDDPNFGTFYTFPNTEVESLVETEETECPFKKRRRERKGLPFSPPPLPQKTDRLKIGETKVRNYSSRYPKIDMQYYQDECNARMGDTYGCRPALVLPIPDCHLGFNVCKKKCHKKNSLDFFVSLSFREKCEEMRGFLTFWNAVVNGRC